ncbi:MAG: hypothetical protein AUJ71_03405 [Candidatus Omnitrophica bacterium CG1_02_49_16]|nr:MAG: hypothetical protein AUJ71_03405 [Candidatus Omnitrophica bacterium CG1_02_49_16]
MENNVAPFPRERVRQANFFVDTHFRVIHEDTHILVIHKPAPLAVHPVGSYFELNLHSLLKKDVRWADTKIHFTHRLDAETSGVILIAKTYEAARFLGKEFITCRVKKKYHALVFGTPDPAVGSIDLPLGHDKSSGFQTVRIVDRENGQTARTDYTTLSTNGEYSFLEIKPCSGRTHQIRAHLAFIGHPVVGDKIYIDLNLFSRYVIHGLDDEMLERLKLRRLALHASEISFTHPATREWTTFKSELPADIKTFLEKMEGCDFEKN